MIKKIVNNDYFEDSEDDISEIPKRLTYFKLYEFRTKYGQIDKKNYRPKYKPGMKRYGYKQVRAEGLGPIIDNYKLIMEEYNKELKESISEEQVKLFLDLLKDWVDGKSKRNGLKIQSLKKDIYQYMCWNYPTLKPSHIFCEEDVTSYTSGGLRPETIHEIIVLNDIYFDKCLRLISADDCTEINFDDIMFYRGMNIPSDVNLNSTRYNEINFLTSYSISINVAEKFSVTGYEKKVIVSSDRNNFYNRIIACSLLHSPLKKSQLELLTIPHWQSLELKFHNNFDDIPEYMLKIPDDYKGKI